MAMFVKRDEVLKLLDGGEVSGQLNPPRNGEGDRDAERRGGGGPQRAQCWRRAPSTMLRMVPLPVPGRIWGRQSSLCRLILAVVDHLERGAFVVRERLDRGRF